MSYFEDYIEGGLCCATCGTFIGFEEPGHVQYCSTVCDPASDRRAEHWRPSKASRKPSRRRSA